MPACNVNLTVPSSTPSSDHWQHIRNIVLARDQRRCVDCGEECNRGEADVHHLIPRSIGGSDEPSNLVTLCDGCHGAHHPNLQASLSGRFIERWGFASGKVARRTKRAAGGYAKSGRRTPPVWLREVSAKSIGGSAGCTQGRIRTHGEPDRLGKTLCFQMPTLLRPGTAFVISPLKALMSDQVSSLQRKKIPAPSSMEIWVRMKSACVTACLISGPSSSSTARRSASTRRWFVAKRFNGSPTPNRIS
jgi:ATP-dependent DNA helicase RecQ